MTTYSLRQSDWIALGEKYKDVGPALRILALLLKGFEQPPILRFWDGTVVAPSSGEPRFTLVVHDPSLLRHPVLQRNPLWLADAYFKGALDIQGGLYSALRLKDHFSLLLLSWRERLALLREVWRLPVLQCAVNGSEASVLSRSSRRNVAG